MKEGYTDRFGITRSGKGARDARERDLLHRRRYGMTAVGHLDLMEQWAKEVMTDLTRRQIETTSDSEKQRLGHEIERFKSQAEQWRHNMVTAQQTQEAHEIRAWRERETRRLAEALRASQHEGYTEAYRQAERARIEGEYRMIDSLAEARMQQWVEAQTAASELLYHSEPEGDAATETRRLRREMEVKALADQYTGRSATEVRNHLVAEGRRLASIGAMDKASVYHDAASRLGVEDGTLGHTIRGHLDSTVPHRKQAVAQRNAAAAEADALRLEVARSRVLYGIGSTSDQASSSVSVKVREWQARRQGEDATPRSDARSDGTPSPLP